MYRMLIEFASNCNNRSNLTRAFSSKSRNPQETAGEIPPATPILIRRENCNAIRQTQLIANQLRERVARTCMSVQTR